MNLSARDQASVWHPFTQHQTHSSPLPIVRGSGAYLMDENGNRYLDLISSWWVNLHGHSHPTIAKAIYEQALSLEHVIFAGFTHEPAVRLAEELLTLLPAGYTKIFYSDNGSTSVEIGLKMAYQYWRNKGDTQRRRFMAFRNGYHGDTFGSMSVGQQSGYFSHFSDLLFQVDMFPYPATWLHDSEVELTENTILEQLKNHLELYADETVAMILEPLVQGAGGMQMCSTLFLQKLEKLIHSYGLLIIYDEVMTGFGRTGNHFASIKSQTKPDIICLAKGLTGGFLPLAATACQQKIYDAFLSDKFSTAFAHGHSYTANPLGCAAALASLELLKSSSAHIKMIEETHHNELDKIINSCDVLKPRVCGTIAAFDINSKDKYGSQTSHELQISFREQGLLIRPLGNVIYLLPPYCTTEIELRNAYKIVSHELQGLKA